MDWQDLGFEFRPTKSHLKVEYKNGAWGSPELVSEPYIKLHIGATALHYGQACFEGLKAYAHEDNSVHMFRPDENAKRLRSSCERTMMPVISEEVRFKRKLRGAKRRALITFEYTSYTLSLRCSRSTLH